MGQPFSPKNLPLPMGYLDPHLIQFPGSTRVLNPNGISIGAASLQGSLVRQTDRQTDRQTTLLGW